ncbi:DUF992 domain-containing protein [Roseibium sp. RKSG952]|uniref:DUF992 domain-containing protein n=1 Tax=Roseibium sp. RKSG952 TaxID=2529384 RepID=UPI0012BD6092|nr:DUF992 domain-containing protein [Roseibium sp. RKSG952]MTH99596.1 DUF992 domain-containing protein [Roseibium sp. RKSG952]
MKTKLLLAVALILVPFASSAQAADVAKTSPPPEPAVAASVAPSHGSPGVKAGLLSCSVTNGNNFIVGSKHALACQYKPVSGPPEAYTGEVSQYGVDIGPVRNANLVWAVFAPSTNTSPGALSGRYGGVSAGASALVGAQANVLVGGSGKSIALNPVSLQSETGLNVTAGVTGMSLHKAS